MDLSEVPDGKDLKSSSSTESQSGYKTDSTNGFVRENISVTGVAQKGPFQFGSPLTLFELKKDLSPSGLVYSDEINSNKGDFVIPKVTLAHPYAKLEVRGLYRNEVTANWSTDSMTLRALTDFSDKRTDANTDDRAQVNINLLTHLEYDRALYLVQEKGYSVYAAKKQAAQEIMTAFEFATAVTYSEDFAIFQNDGVGANTIAGNGTLLAISALVMGNRSDAEIQNTIDNFIADIRTDGEWNDLQTKADMADWAYDFDYKTIRASVKSWNILDIPDFETYLDAYWNNVYGLGGCSVNRKDIVAPNSNKLSKYYNKYFICAEDSPNSYKWMDPTTFEKDTYEWTAGKNGELKKGNVTDSIYVCKDSNWVVAERETAIGLCTESKVGKVSMFDSVYYICRNNAWEKATVLEYDTYGLAGKEGDVKAGVVNKNKYYVFDNGKWRASANEIENNFGACVTSREGEKQTLNGKYYVCESKKWNQITEEEFGLGYCSATNEGVVSKLNGVYYICKSKAWTEATALEYDTYGWDAGKDGEVKAGSVNTNSYYIYKNNKWQVATVVESDLGGCIINREGEVGKSGNIYYICKSKAWTTATELEYDTYGEKCTSAEVNKTIEGVVTSTNKYYCTSNGWVSLMGGWSWDVPKEARLNPEISYGTMTDSRDMKVYKTVKIGDQTWMAENLNYADSVTTTSLKGKSGCYKNVAKNCEVAGRLYTWAAAIDSVKLANEADNPQKCGYGKTCTLPAKVQGVCPPDWHLPTNAEWETLFTAVGSELTAGRVLKSQTGWNRRGNGSDTFGFSALPAGYRYYDGSYDSEGYRAYFWSSTEDGSNYAYYLYLDFSNGYVYLCSNNKYFWVSVRCVKD